MKNMFKLKAVRSIAAMLRIAVIAFVAAIVFSMTACDTDDISASGGGDKYTVIALDMSEDEFDYAFIPVPRPSNAELSITSQVRWLEGRVVELRERKPYATFYDEKEGYSLLEIESFLKDGGWFTADEAKQIKDQLENGDFIVAAKNPSGTIVVAVAYKE